MMAFALLAGLLPAVSSPVQAADYYFTPDIAGISNTRNKDINGTPDVTGFAYSYDNAAITINGIFQSVDGTSITVKVEQLTKSSGKWVVNSANYYNSGVTVSGLNFTASALNLFSGYNKITFTGLQGSVERSESFYILYNDMPMLQSLKIGSGSEEPINLNEGTQVVLSNKTVYLQGKVQNATQILFNNQVSYPQNDGTFYSPTITLTPGRNDLTMVIKNSSNSLTIKRTVYYFDKTDPFISFTMQLNGHTYDLNKGNKPTVTDTATSATFSMQLLVPNLQKPAPGNTTFSIDGTTYAADVTEVTVPGNDGVTIAYRLVTLKTTAPYTLSSASSQSVTANVYYTGTAASFSANLKGSFNYLPGETAIANLSLLEDYNGTETDLTKVSMKSLHDSQVTDETFYIALEADKDYTDTAVGLEVRLLPLATTNLKVEYVGYIDSAAKKIVMGTPAQANTKKVYKISGLPNGAQSLQFVLFNKSPKSYMQSSKNATVNYVSQNYIKVDNLYQGQVITIDSKLTDDANTKITLTGQFVGFKSELSPDDTNKNQVAQLWINSTKISDFHTTGTANTFSYGVKITETGAGTFHFGQNTIVLEAQYQSESGTDVRTVRKEITFYILDKNVATIEKFRPGVYNNKGTLSTMSDTEIFKPSYDLAFSQSNGVYVSRDKTYDVILKGLNATKVVLKKNGEILDTYAPTATSGPTTGTNFTAYGNQDLFYIRINNQKFNQPETHTYVVELYNATGAKVTQTLQVSWAYNSYQILSPVPNVGNRIVVNKNFVTIDIQAEGATSVLVAGKEATKKQETADTTEHYVYEYVGLKADKDNTIKFSIVRNSGTVNGTITVYYTSSVQVGSQFKQEMGTKFTMFDKGLELKFPKNTLLKKYAPSSKVEEFYDHNLRFGIASSTDGVVERRRDNGTTTTAGGYTYYRFSSTSNRTNFTTISPVYWISGGIGEDPNFSVTEKDGLEPYDSDGTFMATSSERKLVPTNRGTLTLKFNGSVVDAASSTLTVFYLGDDSNTGWQRIGGTVDAKSNTITVPFDDFGYYMVAKLRTGFQDITNHSWARNVLEGMYSKGFMENLRYQEFGPYDYATRGEFATLLVKSLNIPLMYDENQTFIDVYPTSKSTTWEYRYVETAARVGIVTGYDNQIFMPDGRLTREQAAVMIARAMELKLPTNDAKLTANLEKLFTDTASMNYYAKPAVLMVNKEGIMLGEENVLLEGQKKATYRFNPQGQLKRDEAAQIAVRLLQKYTEIFPKNLN